MINAHVVESERTAVIATVTISDLIEVVAVTIASVVRRCTLTVTWRRNKMCFDSFVHSAFVPVGVSLKPSV